jgi:trans-2,3-dihydro-3-hydroxyanthranilate isomerase
MLAYDVVDVFGDRPFSGNQLAVVHGADDLSAAQCLAVAREFGYSETTFPAETPPGGDAGRDAGQPATEYATRIFTPGAEIPFAGHPTLGTAWVLRHRGRLSGPHVTQHCGAGRIPVRFDDSGLVELSAPPRDQAGPLPDDLVRDVLGDIGLSTADLAAPAWLAGCGLTFLHVPVVRDAVARATVSRRPLAVYDARLRGLGDLRDPVEGINVVHVAGEAPALTVHARVFVPGLSVPEDPATGSAAAGLGVALVAGGMLPEGGAYEIAQGLELGRPSVLHGRVETTTVAGHGWNAAVGDEPPGQVPAVCHVAGRVHHVASGEIAVPEVS